MHDDRIRSMGIADTLGNRELLSLPKVGFLCSRKAPASAVLKCYDWAIEQRNLGTCVVSGFHSRLEQDVLHFLLKGNQPKIMVLARGMFTNLPKLLQPVVESGRLLIITQFERSMNRVTGDAAIKRNKLLIELVDKVVIGCRNESHSMHGILVNARKPIQYLDDSGSAGSVCEKLLKWDKGNGGFWCKSKTYRSESRCTN